VQTLVLEGATHSTTLQVKVDDRLEIAVRAFCAAAPPSVGVIRPGDLLLRISKAEAWGDGIVDQWMCTFRSKLYNGTRPTPKVLKVVFRDFRRQNAALDER
jgi:hypothetical protein